MLYMYAPGADAIHAASGPLWNRISLVSPGVAAGGRAHGLFYASPRLSPGTLWLVVAGAGIRVRVLFPAHSWVDFHASAVLFPGRPLQAALSPPADPFAGPWVLTVAFDSGSVYTLSSNRITDELVAATGVSLASAFLALDSHAWLTVSPLLDDFLWYPERRGGGLAPASIAPVPVSYSVSRWFVSVSQRGTYSAFEPLERRNRARVLGVGAASFMLNASECGDLAGMIHSHFQHGDIMLRLQSQ